MKSKSRWFIRENITPGISLPGKEIQIHDLVCQTVFSKSRENREDHTIIGAILNRSCACAGYAEAFKFYCDRADIDSLVIVGNSLDRDGIRDSHA